MSVQQLIDIFIVFTIASTVTVTALSMIPFG